MRVKSGNLAAMVVDLDKHDKLCFAELIRLNYTLLSLYIQL